MSTTRSNSSVAYEPPKQSGLGQVVDSIIIILMLFIVLFGVTYYTESSASSETPATQAIDDLPLTDGEKVAYQRAVDQGLVDEETASTQVLTQLPTDDKYPIDISNALLTFAVIAAYLWFIFAFSFRQYRDVIEEKFGPSSHTREEVEA